MLKNSVVHCCEIETMSGDAVGYMKKLVENKTGTDKCGRCGLKHDEMIWQLLLNPVVSAPEGAIPSAVIGYAMCPNTSQPVFIQAWDMGDD